MNIVAVPEVVAIARPDPALIQSAEQFLALARTTYGTIETLEQCEAAGEDLKALKVRQKQLEEARTSITRPLLDAQRAVNELFRGPQETLVQAERIIKAGILSYQEVLERQRREAEAAAAEALRKEREKLETQAAKAEASGKLEKAEALRTTAAILPQHLPLEMDVRLSGIATKSTWRAEVIDKVAFVAYVAGHPEWLHLLEVNATALNGLARSQKSSLGLPGVRSVEEKQLSARRT